MGATSVRIGQTTLDLVEGDITAQRTDAIVNAANTTLLGGGGVDGAIHRAGGPTILAECRTLGGCATGDAKPTPAGRLPAKWIIHAVGPVYRDGTRGEGGLLASAYRRSLEVAIATGARSVAFPSISTGAYRFPVAEAARIGLGEAGRFVRAEPDTLDLVRWVLFCREDLETYAAALGEVAA